MDKNVFDAVKAQSNEWKDAIAEFLLAEGVPVNRMSTLEQLEALFDVESCEFYDLFKKIKNEHKLNLSIPTRSLPHLDGVVRNTFKLCEDIIKLPASDTDKAEQGNLAKHRSMFHSRGEQAVFQILRSLNMNVVDIQVRTNEIKDEELLYWNGDRIYLMSFVSELDEDYAVSQIFRI